MVRGQYGENMHIKNSVLSERVENIKNIPDPRAKYQGSLCVRPRFCSARCLPRFFFGLHHAKQIAPLALSCGK